MVALVDGRGPDALQVAAGAGSVIAIAEISSPLTSPGSQRRFCSSVPRLLMYGTMMSVWTGKPSPLAPMRPISSLTIML